MPDQCRQRTKERILAATRQELLTHGLAGARVDRIATLAKTSKERIYHYFKNKTELADHVWLQQAEHLHATVIFDPEDIHSFVGNLFDYFHDRPEDVRLWFWYMLERGRDVLPIDDFRVVSVTKRIESVKIAQARGHIDAAWDPTVLLDVLISLAISRMIKPSYAKEAGSAPDEEQMRAIGQRHRAAVIEIALQLIASAPESERQYT